MAGGLPTGSETELLIVADDLTGANDTDAMFADRGLQTGVRPPPGRERGRG